METAVDSVIGLSETTANIGFSLLDAIYERYSDLIDLNGLNTYSLMYKGGNLTRSGFSPRKSQSLLSDQTEPVSESEIQILTSDSPKSSPRKPVFTSTCVVLTSKQINCVGDSKELENICKNLQELDISNNKFSDWNQIKVLLSSLKRLRFLNLTYNRFSKFKIISPEEPADKEGEEDIIELEHNEDLIKSTLEYFTNEWPLPKLDSDQSISSAQFDNLKTLILNECFIDLRIIECLLQRLDGLTELHLSRNKYKQITFSKDFVKLSLKILYIHTNNLDNWNELCKLGKCFPNLEHLVLSQNEITNFTIDPNYNQDYFENAEQMKNSNLFKNLNILNLNKIKINDWSAIDQLREFPSLKHIRIHDIPLLDKIKNDEERHFLLVGHLTDNINYLNGSSITREFRDMCERKYLRYLMEQENKPSRFYELEAKHGKLDKLVDLSLEKSKTVHVKIKFEDNHKYENVKIQQTVGELKKGLEKFVGHPASRFRIFYIDTEGAFGYDELKRDTISLTGLNMKDGDEFDICLKPVLPAKKKI